MSTLCAELVQCKTKGRPRTAEAAVPMVLTYPVSWVTVGWQELGYCVLFLYHLLRFKSAQIQLLTAAGLTLNFTFMPTYHLVLNRLGTKHGHVKINF